MSNSGIKGLLLAHVEKLVVVLVLLIIIIYLICLAVSPSAPKKLKVQTEEYIEKIQGAMNNPNLPESVEVNYAQEVKQAFVEVPPAGREPQWFAYKRPYVVRKAKFRHPDQPTHLPPSLTAEKDIGQVKLAWSDSAQNQFVKITGYILERREGEKGKWKELVKFEADVKEHLDTTAKPEMKYFYRLTSVAEPAARGVPFNNPEETCKMLTVEILFNLKFDTAHMDILGNVPDPNTRIGIDVTRLKPGGQADKKKITLRRGDEIVIEGFKTGWKLKDFGEKNFSLGIKEHFIIIVKEGMEKRIPPLGEKEDNK